MPSPARRRSSAGANNPDFTPDGADRLEKSGAEFRSLLETQAVHRARRRGARSVDNTDVETARQQLLNPRERPLFVDILAEFGLVAAGALIGYATTLLTSSSSLKPPGFVLLAAGIFVCALCAIVKHVEL